MFHFVLHILVTAMRLKLPFLKLDYHTVCATHLKIAPSTRGGIMVETNSVMNSIAPSTRGDIRIETKGNAPIYQSYLSYNWPDPDYPTTISCDQLFGYNSRKRCGYTVAAVGWQPPSKEREKKRFFRSLTDMQNQLNIL